MKHKPAMYALLRLHAKIGGQIRESKKEIKALRVNLRHVQAVIHLIEPGFDLRSIIPKKSHAPNPWFGRGETLHRALDVLRRAHKPLTTRQIAETVLQERGVKAISERLVHKTANSIHVALNYRRGKSVMAHDELKPVRWSCLDVALPVAGKID